MKNRMFPWLVLAFCLAGGRGLVRADDIWDSGVFYAPTGNPRPIVAPSGTAQFNCILPENSGGYVTVWDDATNRLVVVRGTTAADTHPWLQQVTLGDGENTRVVLGSATRVLWCSAQRWVFLDRASGTVLSTATWDQPLLDPQKVILRDEILHFISDGLAYRFDTNMTQLATVIAEPPQGYWASYAGAWLVDLSNRRSHSVRFASIGNGLQGEIPLPTSLAEGYTDNRVLSANSETMLVLSTINWPDTTLHYFTLFNADGILWQRRMSAMETITGVTALTNGWLLSAQTVGETTPKHYLFRMDPNGRIYAHLRLNSATPQSYLALNTLPPRLLHVVNSTTFELLDVAVQSGWGWWTGKTFFDPAIVDLRSSTAKAPVGSTNSFWCTAICPNNQ